MKVVYRSTIFAASAALILFVAAQWRDARAQTAGEPGVLGRHERHAAEHLEGAQGDVAQVADGGGHDVQLPAPCRNLGLGLWRAHPRREPGRRRG